MKTNIYPCQPLADEILAKCRTSAEKFTKTFARKPRLAVVLVGEDPASKIYVGKKSATCQANGIEPEDVRLPAQISQSDLEKEIHRLNLDDTVDGILVQSPLPSPLDEKRIQYLIDPAKDVDCFHPLNFGKLALDPSRALEQGLVPCTPAGAMEVLRANKIATEGAHAVVIGRSNIVGKPMALFLQAANATVTLCHSRTRNLAEISRTADILVVGIGKARFVGKDFVKPGAALIDVGINRVFEQGKNRVVGDIDAKEVGGIAGFLTPVPKGIGPMTIALLLRNTVRAAFLRKGSL
jgi:methylenetetrahydrofolate dehydrogenase (NADP+)/methenyltetrahydrofolate cyclohydrolase